VTLFNQILKYTMNTNYQTTGVAVVNIGKAILELVIMSKKGKGFLKFFTYYILH